MQRLIMEYNVGDYTYSADITLPFIYKDKQTALDDLTLVLLEYVDTKAQYDKVNNRLSDQLQEVGRKLQNCNKEKVKKELGEEYMVLRQEYAKHRDTLATEFSFGGAKLHYENFFYRTDDGKYELNLPEIKTLDEYFGLVELNCQINPDEIDQAIKKVSFKR